MIVVNGDYYSSRSWCRREIQLFSKPSERRPGIWEKPLILIVQAMQGGTLANAIPEFGTAPVLRWRAGDSPLCIDTVLRETIFRRYHSFVASALQDELTKKPGRRLFINWPPDPLGLEFVVREWDEQQTKSSTMQGHKKRARKKASRPLEVLYPGPALSTGELQVLTERFSEVSLTCFDEVRHSP